MGYSLAGHDVFEFADCLLVIPRHAPRLFLLNPTARTVWEQTARGIPPSEIAERLAERFEISSAQVRADVAGILAEWRAHGLLRDAAIPLPLGETQPSEASCPALDGLACRSLHADRVYALCGLPIRVRFETPEIEQAIHPPLAHSVTRSSQPAGVIEIIRDGAGYLVICNGSDVERATVDEEALGQVLGRILELSYPEAEWLAVMHAAAVGDGRSAVVIAGDSGSGKSTLTAALVHAGLRYFSDDVVPLDQSRRIRPMPLGISLKQGSWPVLASLYPELATLPVHQGRPRRYLPVAKERTGLPTGLPVKLLVFPVYRPQQPTVLHSLSPLETLERLTSSRSWMSLDGRQFAATLQWIRETPAYELSYGSLEEAVRIVKRLLSGERPALRSQRR